MSSWDAAPIGGSGHPGPKGAPTRIGDSERERAVSDLGEHFAAGRLTADELDERLERAWKAKTAADLAPLFADLPGSGVAVRRDQVAAQPRFRSSSPGMVSGVPVPILVVLAVVLTIITHVPFVLFILWWFVMGRFFVGRRFGGRLVGGGFRLAPYAIRR